MCYFCNVFFFTKVVINNPANIRLGEDVLKTSWRHNCKTSCKLVLKTSWRCLEDVLEDVLKMSWKRLEDVLKTSWRRFRKTYCEYVLKTSWKTRNVCWESPSLSTKCIQFILTRLSFWKFLTFSLKNSFFYRTSPWAVFFSLMN